MKVVESLALLVGLFLITRPQVKENIKNNFDDAIFRISAQEGNDPYLIKAIIRVESSFNPKAHLVTSKEDSRGLGQINILQTKVLKNLNIDPDRLYDPEYNIWAVNQFVTDIRKRYSFPLDIFAAYNGGNARKDESGQYSNAIYVSKAYGFYTLYKGYA